MNSSMSVVAPAPFTMTSSSSPALTPRSSSSMSSMSSAVSSAVFSFMRPGAGFAVLAHPDFHLVVAQFEDGLAGGGMRRGADRHRERAHVALHAFGDFEALIERAALLGGGARHFVDRQEADQAAAVFRIGSAGDVLVREDHLDVQAFALEPCPW